MLTAVLVILLHLASIIQNRPLNGPFSQGFVLYGSPNTYTDLGLINGSVYINFPEALSTVNIAADAANHATEIRVLRYSTACPGDVDLACTQTIAQAAAFAGTNKGLFYELGNEPGIQDGLSGLTGWEVALYNAIKTADPTSTIDGPGVFCWNNCGWSGLTEGAIIYGNYGLKYDRIALHVYPQDACMQGAWVTQAEEQFSGPQSFGKPVDMTEMGDWYQECATHGQPTPSAATREADVATAMEFAQGAGIQKMIWFTSRQCSPPACTGNLSGWLINPDSSLSPEGLGWVQ